MLRSTIIGCCALGALVAVAGAARADEETVIEKRTVEETAPPVRERVIERTVEQPPAAEKRTETTVVTKDNDNENDNANVDVDVDVDD